MLSTDGPTPSFFVVAAVHHLHCLKPFLDATEVKARVEALELYTRQTGVISRMWRSTKGSRSSTLLHIPSIILSCAAISTISAPRPLTSNKDTGRLDLILEPLKAFSTYYSAHLPHSPMLTMRTSLVDISNTVHRSHTTGACENDLSSLLPRSCPAMHVGRVATVDCHDTDTWTQQRKAHDIELNAVATSSSLDSSGTAPDKYFPVDAARSSFAPMGLQSEPRVVWQLTNACWPGADTTARPHDSASPVTPSLGVSPVPSNISIGSCSYEDLSEGRRRVGEILARCGVIDVLGMSPIDATAMGYGHNSDGCPANPPAISSVTAKLPFGEHNELLIASLADWTSQWVHTLVVQPYLQGNFRFQYQGKPSRASTSVGLRIRRILNDVENPVQVVIHALWLICTLTGNGADDIAPFLSVPLFRYLHNNGTFIVEDFMFRTFVTCAMIGDKAINDATLSTNTWNRLTRIPHAILNATEKYALSCLKWNVVMTQNQWYDTIVYLRSCIKMGSVFDPFAYDDTSPSGIMAHCLDELINVSYAQQGISVECLAPQPIQDSTQWGSPYAAEWCPEDDPVINQKPRTIGIAPGADRNSRILKVGTTAKDLLDSILGSSNIPDLAHLAQPAGTSFCGSFGTIGARLAYTIKIASACRSASWVPSHG